MEEENTTLNKPMNWGTRLTTVNIAVDLHQLAKQENITIKEATEFGIRYIIAEKNGYEYPEGKQTQKIQNLSEKIQILYDEISELKGENGDEVVKKSTPETIVAEVDSVLGGIIDENAESN